MPYRSIYEEHGNNEPYIELDWDGCDDARDPELFIQYMRILSLRSVALTSPMLIQGPSTNIYVGLEEVHFTIPKRLLYHFSDFAKKCLEGNFVEARANAIWLPDVRPDVFQWLCRWLYTGRLDFTDQELIWCDVFCQEACDLLCQMHMLGERLLFTVESLRGFKERLSAVIDGFMECVKSDGRKSIQWMADIIYDVLSGSAPIPQSPSCWGSMSEISLRSALLSNLCAFDFCTRFNFRDYGEAFALDGEFAAEIMMYLARELEWAVELWGAQTQSLVNVADKKLQDARENGTFMTVTTRPKENLGRWLALRHACTYTGCTTTDFRAYKKCFEIDGSFATEIIDFMVTELRWVVERWGQERGPEVDVALEKEDEEHCLDDYDDMEPFMRKRWCY